VVSFAGSHSFHGLQTGTQWTIQEHASLETVFSQAPFHEGLLLKSMTISRKQECQISSSRMVRAQACQFFDIGCLKDVPDILFDRDTLNNFG